MSNKHLVSRLSALQKSKEAHPVKVEEGENLTEDNVSTWEGHTFKQNISYEVYEAVDLQHPLSFEDCNICKIGKGRKLKKSESRGTETHLGKICIDNC